MSNDTNAVSNAVPGLLSYFEERPIVGGTTSVTLTSAATLASLGLSVAPLGSATASVEDGNLVARFGITGGTEQPGGADTILHQGSGLRLSNASGSAVDLTNFRVDTQNGTIGAQVTVDGTDAGEVGVFNLGAGGALTLTATAAGVLDETFHTSALTTTTPIGAAAPSPVALAPGEGPLIQLVSALAHVPPATGPGELAFISGATSVALTSAPVLASLGVKVAGVGSAVLLTNGSTPTALFGVTGGTAGPEGDVILHDGSGLSLSDAAGRITLRDFLIDTENKVVDANVTVNGKAAGNLGVFALGADGSSLTLTAGAASAADKALGTTALTSGVVIGKAAPEPFALPSAFASLADRHVTT